MKKIILFIFALFVFPVTAQAVDKETAYDRIMRTGTIRCGYVNWSPAIAKDPETGIMEGYIAEYIEEIAASLDLKVDWTEEVNMGTYLLDLANGRYDLECAGGWANALRGKFIYYTDPFVYQPAVPFVRSDDTRFDGGVETLYGSGLKAAVIDGDTSQDIRDKMFPNMEEVSLPMISSTLEYFVAVSSGKADVTFSDYVGGVQYMKKNPGKIKALPYRLRLVPMCIGVAPGEERLWHMLNTANQQLILNGTVDTILDKYETEQGMFVRVNNNLNLARRAIP